MRNIQKEKPFSKFTIVALGKHISQIAAKEINNGETKTAYFVTNKPEWSISNADIWLYAMTVNLNLAAKIIENALFADKNTLTSGCC